MQILKRRMRDGEENGGEESMARRGAGDEVMERERGQGVAYTRDA